MVRVKMLVVAVSVIVLFLGLGLARAEPGGTTHLIVANVTQLAGIDIHVVRSHDLITGNLILSVLLVSNPLVNTPLGIDQFFYNSAVTVSSVTDPGAGPCVLWTTNFNGGTADGFDGFLSLKNACSGGTGGVSGPGSEIIFKLSADPAIALNANNAKYAIHIRFSGSCSGFVAGGFDDHPSTTTFVNSGSITSDTNCVPKHGVPEFSVPFVALMTALAPVFFLLKRRTTKAL